METWMLVLILPVALIAYLFLHGYRSPARLREIAQALADGAPLVDVRTPGEFAAGHHRRARNVPLDTLGSRVDELGAPGDPVVVHCQSGARSAQAARLLRSRGFTRVHDLGAYRNLEKLPEVAPADEAEPLTRNQRRRERQRRTRRD